MKRKDVVHGLQVRLNEVGRRYISQIKEISKIKNITIHRRFNRDIFTEIDITNHDGFRTITNICPSMIYDPNKTTSIWEDLDNLEKLYLEDN